MIVKLHTIDMVRKAKLAEAKGDFRQADECIRLAQSMLLCAPQFAQKFAAAELATMKPTNSPDYISQQKASNQAVNQATVAWTEYITSLFSRVPQASGKDAMAIAEYAKDIQKKIMGLNALGAEWEAGKRQQMRDWNLNRKVSPIAEPSMTANLGSSAAYGSLGTDGLGKNITKGLKEPWQQGGQLASQMWQQGKQIGKMMPKGVGFPTFDPGKAFEAPSYENKSKVGKQKLLMDNYLQNSPYNMTTEQIMGTEKGTFSLKDPVSVYKDHPAMKDPASNEKGFKAMEACWTEYFYKYLPKYGISGGKATGPGGVPSTANSNRRPIEAQVATPPAPVAAPVKAGAIPTLPPVPDAKPPKGSPSWKDSKAKDSATGGDIPSEEIFFKNVFVEVEKRMSGKDGEGATLKGVVKKAVLAYLVGAGTREKNIAELMGSGAGMAGGVASFGLGQAAGSLGMQGVAQPLTQNLLPPP